MERKGGELGQMSIHLAKIDAKFGATVDLANGARGNPKFVDHQFTAEGVDCRLVYFETTNRKDNPPWLDFVNTKLPPRKQLSFGATSRNANGILGLTIDGRLFVATFGRSASSLLVRKFLEPDFGIKTAMNLCGNEGIRQTRTQNNSIVATHIDRQTSRPSDAFAFGLSETEDLKSISAHLRGNPKITLQGRDHLTIKVIGDNRLSWPNLFDHCRKFLHAYDSRDYVDSFPNYRNFEAATEEQCGALDDLLLQDIKSRKFDKIQMWIPEFIPNDEFSFTYTDNRVKENLIYSHLEPKQLEDELNFDHLSVDKLKSKKIFAYSHLDDRVLSSKWWSLYDCLVYEEKLGERYFLLTDGVWKVVDDDFYNSIVEFVSRQVKELPVEPIFTKISIASQDELKNKEEVFNFEVCKRRPTAILFDQAKLRIGKGRKDKEFCDILDLTDDGKMRIINCKPYKGSSAVTYLFAQTRFYCESFLRDQKFLDAIRGHVSESTSPTKEKYLKHIAEELKDVNGSDYQVCIWLLVSDRETVPTREALPLIAKYELKLLHEYLLQVCKFKEIVLRFVPVSMINFKKSASPN